MGYLLDTHTLLWSLTDPNMLTKAVRDKIEQSDILVYVSLINFWEIAIKLKTGKLELDVTLLELEQAATQLNFILLPLHFRHILLLGNLELHHRDPFDRMLIAQAFTENLTLVSCDSNFNKYGVSLLW